MKPLSAILAALACAAFATHDVRAAETIRRLGDIKFVNIADAAPPGVPFDITGLVVYFEDGGCGDGKSQILIKDNSGLRTLLNYLSATNAPIRKGDFVRAIGRVVLEHNGILVHCHEMTPLAHGASEPSKRLTIEELLSGQHDGRLVTVRGEIRDSFIDDIDDRFLFFSLKDGEKPIYMAVATNSCAQIDRDGIIGDMVEATGIWISGRDNGSRRHIGRFLMLVGDNPLRTIKPSKTDIFNAPEITDLKSLMPSEVPSDVVEVHGVEIGFGEPHRLYAATGFRNWRGREIDADNASVVGLYKRLVALPRC